MSPGCGLQCTTAVDAEWLAELGPMFFSVRESVESRIVKRKKERDELRVMEEEHATKLKQDVADVEARRDADKRAKETAPTPRQWMRSGSGTPVSGTGRTSTHGTPLTQRRRTPSHKGL